MLDSWLDTTPLGNEDHGRSSRRGKGSVTGLVGYVREGVVWLNGSKYGRWLVVQRGTGGLNPSDQLFALWATNLLVLIGAWQLLAQGYKSSHAMPSVFKFLELSIVIVSGIASFSDALAAKAGNVARGRSDAKSPSNAGAGLPEWLLKRLVLAFSVMTCIALWQLARHTGRGVTSPFAPLLTAPAVFGPFFARTWQATAVLVLTAVLLVWLAEGEDATRGAHPWVYSGVATIMVAIAGILSIVRQGITPVALSAGSNGG